MKLVVLAFSLWMPLWVGAQSLPPTNLFTLNGGNPLGPPTIPSLTQVHVPQFSGDHSTELNLFRRQLMSIKDDIEAKGESLAKAEERLSMFFGSKAIKPAPGSPGAQFYPFAFHINPSISGTTHDGRKISLSWWRAKYPKLGSTRVLGGATWIPGDGTATPPSKLFEPPANAVLPPITQPSPAPLPVPPPVRPVAPAPPIKVSVHSWAQISAGGNTRTVIMRIVGNFRGISRPAPVRKPSRAVNVVSSSRGETSSRTTTSRGLLFRGYGSFSMHIRTLPSKSFQRMSLRAGR